MDDRSILILYGTETGNAKDASEKIGRCYQSELRRQPTLIDETLVIFVCSTTGNGVEPANMTALWNALLRAELPPDLFEDMEFAVLGLGDSSYQRFNWAAKRLQRRLLSLGGYELCERGDADDQHPQGYVSSSPSMIPESTNHHSSDGVIDPWTANLFKKISERYPLPPGLDILPGTSLYPPMINIIPWNSEFRAGESIATNLVASESSHTMKLTQNTRMTDPSWHQDVRHLIFQTDEDIHYEPGDIAILYPENSPEDVETLLKRLGWEDDADEPIRITPDSEDRSLPLGYPRPDTPTTLRSLITKHADINSVPRKSFIELLAHFTKDKMETEKLQEFCTPEGLDDLFDYTTRVRRTILEVLLEFRSAVVPKEYIADLFPELRPRQFSIASSLSAHPREIHLCVAIVNYRTKLRVPRKGVCTSWLARLEAGVALNVGLKRGTMELPKDNQKPIILVGPGTGVAPMRAMIEERVAKGATGNTLYFGCRSAFADHHFHEDWEAYQKRGVLVYRLAASRDQVGQALLHSPSALLTTSKKERKIYVQELITNDSKEVKERLVDRKGSLYISGYDDFLEFKYAGSCYRSSSNQMPSGVRKAVIASLRDECGWTDDESASYVDRMEMEGRWCEECW
ncbi:Anamorsin -like protein 2 [Rhizoctonia solani]|uniref:NADPH-dependent diflavin oxidoreductase 1 n=1 Tax=Rhizoctonia solani TaxID=456999 RepID=A0A8H7H7S7_9AGAM|nr:Anamorsin -like protein 2 [Rhizoctonia solani]